jgi:predicted RNA-binding Zn-ribbon protein involved in translation (DUF1610 family)
MMTVTKDSFQPDRQLAAACGLFCPSCLVYIAARETSEEREKIVQNLQLPAEDLKCDGCRSANRFAYCDTCKMAACAAEKGIDFCGGCADYPCDDLRTFQAAMPHRLELWQAQARIQEVGHEQWFVEMLEHYACPQCGTLNSAYHPACRECGTTPSCAYVGLHRAEIVAHPASRERSTRSSD